jgi:hypothetical protein
MEKYLSRAMIEMVLHNLNSNNKWGNFPSFGLGWYFLKKILWKA